LLFFFAFVLLKGRGILEGLCLGSFFKFSFSRRLRFILFLFFSPPFHSWSFFFFFRLVFNIWILSVTNNRFSIPCRARRLVLPTLRFSPIFFFYCVDFFGGSTHHPSVVIFGAGGLISKFFFRCFWGRRLFVVIAPFCRLFFSVL